MKRSFSFLAAGLVLAACNLLPAGQNTQINQFFAGLANKATADLQTALAVAQTPAPNLPGGILSTVDVQCLTGSNAPTSIGGLLGAQKIVNGILAVATGPGGGAFTAAEVGTFLIPNSPQLNALTQGLIADCGPKMQQVNAALILGTGAWFAGLGAQFAIAAAPVGAEGPNSVRYAAVAR